MNDQIKISAISFQIFKGNTWFLKVTIVFFQIFLILGGFGAPGMPGELGPPGFGGDPGPAGQPGRLGRKGDKGKSYIYNASQV